MKHGDKYRHFKGNEYFFDCIALPKDDLNIDYDIRRDMEPAGNALYHDGSKTVPLFTYGGLTFIQASVPHVIYQPDADINNPYAREINDFFGFKTKDDGTYVQRFVRKTN